MRLSSTALAVIASTVVSLPSARVKAGEAKALQGAAAYGDWRSDAPGVVRKITPADLPAPFASEPKASGAKVAPRPDGVAPKAPEGFSVTLFASGLKGPRVIRTAPNGDVFVVESEVGRIRAYRLDGDGAPTRGEIFAAGLDQPYGLAFYPPGSDPKWLYVATPRQVARYPYKNGELQAEGKAETIVGGLPSGGHWTRDIVFSPNGQTLYVAVGSKTNVAEGQGRPAAAEIDAVEFVDGVGALPGAERYRADVLTFDPSGGQKRVFATGLRNCSGLALRPGTDADELWCVVNERDMLGDDLPPDYATRVIKRAFYGWPWYYIGAHEDPRHKGERPDLAGKVVTPEVLIQPHSAPLQIAFYEGAQFPAGYRGDAFVTLHGSWNRSKRTGYKVVRLRFKNGAPTGEYEDFLTGFVVDGDGGKVWGRPVGVTVTLDGALLVTEDGAGTIWRVAFDRN